MADVSVSIVDRDVVGSRLVRRATVTFTAGYAVAGETLQAADVELSEIKWVNVVGNPSLDDTTLNGAIVTQGTTPVIRAITHLGALVGTVDLSSTTLDIEVYGV